MSKYVRCTHSSGGNFTDGKIYKVVNRKQDRDYVINNLGFEDCFYYSKCEPATEKDYIEQEWGVEFVDPAIGLDRSVWQNIKLNTDTKPQIDRVIFSDPATVVFWKDGTKTVSKCQDGDTFSEWVGLAICHFKKAYGSEHDRNYIERVIKRAGRS